MRIILTFIAILAICCPTNVFALDYTSQAVEATHQFAATTRQIKAVTVYNNGASAIYLQIADASAMPANGAVVLLAPPVKVSADTTVMVLFPMPVRTSSGFAIISSTTALTKTAAAAACIFNVQFNIP